MRSSEGGGFISCELRVRIENILHFCDNEPRCSCSAREAVD